jgi:hypothetical protein
MFFVYYPILRKNQVLLLVEVGILDGALDGILDGISWRMILV